jgi:hypothetical protein
MVTKVNKKIFNRNNIYEIITNFRAIRSQDRQLPGFIIIGAQKAGTSSLFKYLSQHPQLIPSYKKEIHFFDGGLNPLVDTYKKGERWYRAHFPHTHKCPPETITFEATPSYIFSPIAPKRIKNTIPNVKLILLLRDPVERAISHYFHEKRLKRENLPIEEAFKKEEGRLFKIIMTDDYKNEIFIRNSYKMRGLYYEQIRRYLDYFSLSQLLIINSSDLLRHPLKILKKIFSYLNVDSEFVPGNLKKYNTNLEKEAVQLFVYEYLRSYYYYHNLNLYNLTGINFNK